MILSPWERVYKDILGKEFEIGISFFFFFSRNCSNLRIVYVLFCMYTYILNIILLSNYCSFYMYPESNWQKFMHFYSRSINQNYLTLLIIYRTLNHLKFNSCILF